MLSAATARGLCPCGPRQQLGRRGCPVPQQPHHQRAARHYAAGRPAAEIRRAAVVTDSGVSSGALRSLAPARPQGGLLCPSGDRLLWRTSPVMNARGRTQTAASTSGQAASQQQGSGASAEEGAMAPPAGVGQNGSSGAVRSSPSSSGPVPAPASTPNPDDSADAAAQLLRGALEAALLPAIEGRVGAMEAKIMKSMEAMEARIMQRVGDQEQRDDPKMGELERRLTAAPEALVAEMQGQAQGQEQGELAKEHGRQGKRDQGQGQEEAQVQEQEQTSTTALRDELKAEVAVLRSELLLALARAQQEREGQQAAAADEVAAATASTAAGAKQSSNTQPGGHHRANRKPAWQDWLREWFNETVFAITALVYFGACIGAIYGFAFALFPDTDTAIGVRLVQAVAWLAVVTFLATIPRFVKIKRS